MLIFLSSANCIANSSSFRRSSGLESKTTSTRRSNLFSSEEGDGFVVFGGETGGSDLVPRLSCLSCFFSSASSLASSISWKNFVAISFAFPVRLSSGATNHSLGRDYINQPTNQKKTNWRRNVRARRDLSMFRSLTEICMIFLTYPFMASSFDMPMSFECASHFFLCATWRLGSVMRMRGGEWR